MKRLVNRLKYPDTKYKTNELLKESLIYRG